MKKYTIISGSLHTLFVLFLVLGFTTGNPGGKQGGGNGKDKYKDVNVIPKINNIAIEVIGNLEKDKQAPKSKTLVETKKECIGDWYGGLGLQTDTDLYGNEVIITIYPKYPADLSGLKPGDIVVWKSDEEIRGTPGTEITLKINRNSVQFSVTIVRDKICYEK